MQAKLRWAPRSARVDGCTWLVRVCCGKSSSDSSRIARGARASTPALLCVRCMFSSFAYMKERALALRSGLPTAPPTAPSIRTSRKMVEFICMLEFAPEGASGCFRLNWGSGYAQAEGLDLWCALPRHHSARPRPQLTVCCAPHQHRPCVSGLIASASAPFARDGRHQARRQPVLERLSAGAAREGAHADGDVPALGGVPGGWVRRGET